MSGIVYLNGAYLPKEEARLSPDDRGFLFADGIYEVVRSYGGRFFALDAHLARMTRGLKAIRIQGVEASTVATICREIVERNDLRGKDVTVYLQVTRGVAPRTHWFPDPGVPPTVYASATAFAPKADPTVGVSVITQPDQRWARCDIKTVALLPNCLAVQAARESGAQEALLVRDGVVLEGTHSSFFGVVDGEVRTAPANNYILPSITRHTALDLCAEHGIPVRPEPVLLEELPRASELFLAGTTMEIMPITRVDGERVGVGTPGPVAQRLLELFHRRVGL